MVEKALADYRSLSPDNRSRPAEAVFDLVGSKPYVVIHSKDRILGVYEVFKAGRMGIVTIWPSEFRKKYETSNSPDKRTSFGFGHGIRNSDS